MRSVIVSAMLICSELHSQPASEKRLDIRVVDRKAPPSPQPEPEDDVRIESATGEIVAKSRGLTMRFRNRSAEIKPQVQVSLESSSLSPKFEYKLTNNSGATMAIAGLSLESPYPSLGSWSLPSGWTAIPRGHPFLPPAVLLTKVTPDSDPRLSAGQTVSFVLSGPALPGVIRFIITPEAVQFKKEDLTDGQFFDAASEWVRMKLTELDTRDRHEVRGLIIGAKVPVGQDSIAKIKAEFKEASESRELSTVSRQGFMEVSHSDVTKDQLLSIVSSMAISTPFERAFREAMLLRLSQLP